MKNVGDIWSYFALAFSLFFTIFLISILEPLITFDVAAEAEHNAITAPGAKWSGAMEQLPSGAFLWLIFVYFIGGFSAGLLYWAIGRKKSLLNILSILLAALALIHLSFTPNPIWFWIIAPIAMGLPVHFPKYAFRNKKIERIP